ncbi:MAG TPA: adenosylcobalamin-dependent ribonucleoside-diphosphate reductase [Pseudonocardiaceae bacterium]|nr:adenosylcobalamin-dependent ribonucleoside-diphosphate reductase [Pseudonocardiaceae bacterium]
MNLDVLESLLGLETDGRYESADEIIDRAAMAIASAESRYGATSAATARVAGRFAELMRSNRFWPSGRILNNAGSKQAQLASCFVISIEDSLVSVFDAVTLAAKCHSTGGGTGFDLSRIRERGTPIRSTEGGCSAGPLPWLHLLNAETDAIMRGGKMRGANLASLRIDHPDVIEFIRAKRKVGDLGNFNLSVTIPDEFMEAMATGETYHSVSRVGAGPSRPMDARHVWDELCRQSWRTGDPGILWVDNINRVNPLAAVAGPIETTNPCGEQTMYPYEASNLGSINLDAFVTPDGTFDMTGFEQTVAESTRFLDDAVDTSRYPDPRIDRMANRYRRLGLGVMGWADALVHLGIAYDSAEALSFVERVGQALRTVSQSASRALARTRGPYPAWSSAISAEPVRNCAVTSIAPTGTISMIAGCSAGIEPRFAAMYVKDVLGDDGVTYVDEDLVRDVRRYGGVDRSQAIGMIERASGLDSLPVPAPRRQRYRYAYDISPSWHVSTLATWQAFVDNGVSKTVNLPGDFPVASVSDLLASSWSLGCKGISIYREGSRDRDLMTAVSFAKDRQRQTPTPLGDGSNFRQSKEIADRFRSRAQENRVP